jgi:hypothetical protein
VCARQRGEGEAECGMRLARIALRRRARSGKAGIQLDAGAEQKQITFKRRKLENSAQSFQRCWSRQGFCGFTQRFFFGVVAGAIVGVVFRFPGVPLQCRADQAHRRHQVALVCFRPVQGWRSAHEIVTTGPTKLPEASTINALSAPSTWTRTKYWPTGTPLRRKVIVGVLVVPAVVIPLSGGAAML